MRIIKRYKYRKMWDTSTKQYITLMEIGDLIRDDINVKIITVDTHTDITASILTSLIFEAEKKKAEFASVSKLREIIQSGNGTMSDYVEKFTI